MLKMSDNRIFLKIDDDGYTMYFNIKDTKPVSDVLHSLSCKRSLANYKCLTYKDTVLDCNRSLKFYGVENNAEIKVLRN